MDRRAFLRSSILGILSTPVVVGAQPAGKTYKIGYLAMSPASATPRFGYFRDALRDRGWVDGRNVIIENRSADGIAERFPSLASDLVRSGVDVILAEVPGAVFAAKNATQLIPIVMVNTPDPVELGLVRSLARPGGNITGVTTLSTDISAKQLDLLTQLVPNLSRIAVLSNPTNPWHPNALRLIHTNARSLGVQLHVLKVRGPGDFEGAFSDIAKARAGALLVLADPLTSVHCTELASLAIRHRLPAMFVRRECVAAGGLASYWPDIKEMLSRAAGYVHRILNGAKPGDLPIEQPTKYEFVINLKTAKALGLTIPQPLLLRADEVIQ